MHTSHLTILACPKPRRPVSDVLAAYGMAYLTIAGLLGQGISMPSAWNAA